METSTLETSSTNRNSSSSNYLFRFHQFLSALAIGVTITSIALSAVYRRAFANFVDTEPTTYFTYWYFFLRAGVRFNSFLGQEPQSMVGMTIAFGTVASGTAVLLLLAFNSTAKTRFSRVIFDPIAGAVLLLSIPVSLFLAPDVDLIPTILDKRGVASSLMILLFMAIVAGVVYLTGTWKFPTWAGALLLGAYYVVVIGFGLVVQAQSREYGWIILREATSLSLLRIVLVLLSSSAGVAWMLYARASREGIWQKPMWPSKHILLFSFPWLIFSTIPWLSLKTRSVSNMPDSEYVNIGLKRGSCFGRCPIYTVWLDGYGSATYLGDQFVRTKGPGYATVSKDKIRHLLQSFDNEHFFEMEDRAFPNCADLPWTSVTVSIGRYHKTVTGDSCHGASWPKSGLLRLGQEIDDAVGTEQWVECHGNDCLWR